MKGLLFILLFVFCSACRNDNRIFNVRTKVGVKELETIELAGEKLPIDAMGGYGIKVFDSLLVVTSGSANHFREVYSLENFSLLAELFRKGRAKNEFLFVGYDGQWIVESGCVKLYVHDLNKNVFWKYNLTESVRFNIDSADIVSKLSREYLGAYYISPNIYCYRKVVPNEGYSYVVEDIKKGKVIDEYSILKNRHELEGMELPISNYITKDNDVVICYSRNVNQLVFINLENKTKLSVSTADKEPTWTEWKTDFEQGIVYYDYMAATGKEIYALYRGNSESLEIQGFSESGDFLKRIVLKEKLIAFDVSGTFIYGLTSDEEIYRYKL